MSEACWEGKGKEEVGAWHAVSFSAKNFDLFGQASGQTLVWKGFDHPN